MRTRYLLYLLYSYPRRDGNQEARRGSRQNSSSARGNAHVALHCPDTNVLSSTPEMIMRCSMHRNTLFIPSFDLFTPRTAGGYPVLIPFLDIVPQLVVMISTVSSFLPCSVVYTITWSTSICMPCHDRKFNIRLILLQLSLYV